MCGIGTRQESIVSNRATDTRAAAKLHRDMLLPEISDHPDRLDEPNDEIVHDRAGF